MEEEGFSLDKNPTEEEYSEESEIFKKEINEIYESNELRNLMINNGIYNNFLKKCSSFRF